MKNLTKKREKKGRLTNKITKRKIKSQKLVITPELLILRQNSPFRIVKNKKTLPGNLAV